MQCGKAQREPAHVPAGGESTRDREVLPTSRFLLGSHPDSPRTVTR